MSYFGIKANSMELRIEELNNIYALLADFNERIETVQDSDVGQASGYANVLKALRNISGDIMGERGLVANMRTGLKDILALYIAAEQKICGGAVPKMNKKSIENQLGVAQAMTEKHANPEDMSYGEYLDYRHKNAVDKNTRLLYEKYMKKIRIKDDSYDGTAHYNGLWNHIKYDIDADAENRLGVGSTYYHEVGHLIDDQSDWNSYTSTDWSYDFYDKLEKDVENWKKRIMKEQGYTDVQDAYDDMSTWLMTDGDNKGGISDLVIGLTDGEAHGWWGHDIRYYSRRNTPIEAFAHFFEAGMSADPTKLNYIKEVFPSAYKEYQRMIKDELK